MKNLESYIHKNNLAVHKRCNDLLKESATLDDHGADSQAKNMYGYTPLHWAAKHGHIESAKEALNVYLQCCGPDHLEVKKVQSLIHHVQEKMKH